MPAITTARQSTYDDLLSTTLQAYRPTLVDQVFKAIPLFWFLYDRGRIKHQRGGESIWQIINKRVNSTTKWFEGEDQLDTTPQETFTTVAYPWAYIAGSVSIPLTDEQKNSGSARIKDLLRARMENLQLSMRSDINEACFDTITGDATKAKQPYGLGDIIQDAAAASQTNVVAGIAKNVSENGETYWANQYFSSTSSDFDGALGTGDALPDMDTMYNNCGEGIDNVDLILTIQPRWETVKTLLYANQRWVSTDDRVASLGFQNLVFNGALFMFDKSATFLADTGDDDGLMYFINSRYLYMMTDPAYEFRPTPFKMATNQLTRVAQVVTACQLVCTNMRRQGVLGIDLE